MNQSSRQWIALIPVLSVLLLLIFGITLYALAQSLGYAPLYGINTFPTLDYYQLLWHKAGFWASMGLTLYYAFIATGLALILGFFLALALVKQGRKQTWIHTVYKFPLMVPYLVAIAMAILIFGQGGLVARVAFAFGWIDTPAEFTAILYSHYGWGIIIVYLWKQVPFMALSIYVVLMGIGADTDEAAELLGAKRWQRWLYVVLPQVLPGIASATLICFAFNLGAFEAPFILGGGFPDTLPVLAWRLFTDADYNNRLTGMAAMVVIGLLLFVLIIIAGKLSRQIFPWQGAAHGR